MGSGNDIKNLYMARISHEDNSLSIDTACGYTFPFHTFEDGLVSDEGGNGEEENGDPSELETGDGSEEDPEEIEEEEEEEEETVSNDSASENSVSENGAVSDNSVSENMGHAVDYQDPLTGDIIIQYDSHLEDYMPTVIDLLTIIGALALALVVFELLKYIYKFFRVFF